MNLFRKPGAIAVAALALAALPSTAAAHDGTHPFKNCSEAYASGYSDIPEDDEHYGSHLDRDGDGVGCDQPPGDFVPAEDEGAEEGAAAPAEDTSADGTAQDPDLAETGGDDSTPYLLAGGSTILLAGGALVAATRRRRANH
ncbi:excalibur calcium-binding domain-containing protein [Streptomyces sp. NBC_01352]|uniref:LAETG motif-containing sortase-dependent surface protein n=1 Tax=Streptomyces TaxID=1883 RepID=UPI002255417E|nr:MULTISPECIES: LAETG motif-containing sortase-dependent surface protein [unclassified Streptomyces]MCX4700924.1 excalibur calcium-binding domain-containing protein [Streptomyces sp. NBC_01373]